MLENCLFIIVVCKGELLSIIYDNHPVKISGSLLMGTQSIHVYILFLKTLLEKKEEN